MSSTNTTPEKYRATPPKYEDKEWLYEQYWGEMKSLRDMAAQCGTGHQIIRERMEDFGIPRRADHHTKHNSVSPFTGFYDDVAARSTTAANTVYDENYDPDEDPRSHTDSVGFIDWSADDKSTRDGRSRHGME